MSDIRALYQEMIIDHGRHPRNAGKLTHASAQQEGYNPLCGDHLTLYLLIENDVVKDIKFEGTGCAISMASASLMTQAIKGKTLAYCNALFTDFHQLVTEDKAPQTDTLGKLTVLSGVKAYPSRIKCATLSWHTLVAAIEGSSDTVTTE